MEKKKILIIDDEQINLDFFDVMLTRLGFEVLMAVDGEEGLEAAQGPGIDAADEAFQRAEQASVGDEHHRQNGREARGENAFLDAELIV